MLILWKGQNRETLKKKLKFEIFERGKRRKYKEIQNFMYIM